MLISNNNNIIVVVVVITVVVVVVAVTVNGIAIYLLFILSFIVIDIFAITEYILPQTS